MLWVNVPFVSYDVGVRGMSRTARTYINQPMLEEDRGMGGVKDAPIYLVG